MVIPSLTAATGHLGLSVPDAWAGHLDLVTWHLRSCLPLTFGSALDSRQRGANERRQVIRVSGDEVIRQETRLGSSAPRAAIANQRDQFQVRGRQGRR